MTAKHNLRMLYELRKTIPLSPRAAVGRVFVHFGKFGLSDESGILWPIYFRPHQTPPKNGECINFFCSSLRPDGTQATKYEDEGFFLVVDSINEITESSGQWSNDVLKSPLPPSEQFFKTQHSQNTQFYASPLKRRAELLSKRKHALARTRQFFEARGFLEMETSILVPSGGNEVYLNTFSTQYTDFRKKNISLELPTSPEFALKKLVAEGFTKVFQIAQSFRNEGQLTPWHEPNFLMLEWYRVGANLNELMDDTKSLVMKIFESVGTNITIPTDWKTHTVPNLFKDLVQIDLGSFQSEVDFREEAAKHSHSIVETDDWDSVFCKIFMEKIEPFLKTERACFVSNFPVQMAALARRSENVAHSAERFEAYLNGVEICNGYDELSDATELIERIESVSQRRSTVRRDSVFEKTMQFGLPPCAGNALGIDRVIAILLGLDGITELYPIPFLSQFEKDLVAEE